MLTENAATGAEECALKATPHNAQMCLRYIIYICNHGELTENYLAEVGALHSDAIHLIVNMNQADHKADTFRELDRLRSSVRDRITFHLAGLSCEQKAVLHLLGQFGSYVGEQLPTLRLPGWDPTWNLVQFAMPRMSISPPCLFTVPFGVPLLFVRRKNYFVVLNAISGPV